MKGVTEETSDGGNPEKKKRPCFLFHSCSEAADGFKRVCACFNFISVKPGEITLLSFSFTREA